MHVGAALKDGIEPSEIKEVLLQTAIYAGVPAANTGFHIAQEEIRSGDRIGAFGFVQLRRWTRSSAYLLLARFDELGCGYRLAYVALGVIGYVDQQSRLES